MTLIDPSIILHDYSNMDEKFTTGLEEIRKGSVVASINLNKNLDAK
jgi:hypothetical protein